jgi:hypothetical protein
MQLEPEQTAGCCCGGLRISLKGAPDFVAVCNCTECQRRTGSVFGVGAYYPRASVIAVTGRYATFSRKAESGRTLTNHFCPNCGTSVYWLLEMRPLHVGVAVGCFADAGFLTPTRVIWAQHQHHWVRFPENVPAFPKAAT